LPNIFLKEEEAAVAILFVTLTMGVDSNDSKRGSKDSNPTLSIKSTTKVVVNETKEEPVFTKEVEEDSLKT